MSFVDSKISELSTATILQSQLKITFENNVYTFDIPQDYENERIPCLSQGIKEHLKTDQIFFTASLEAAEPKPILFNELEEYLMTKSLSGKKKMDLNAFLIKPILEKHLKQSKISKSQISQRTENSIKPSQVPQPSITEQPQASQSLRQGQSETQALDTKLLSYGFACSYCRQMIWEGFIVLPCSHPIHFYCLTQVAEEKLSARQTLIPCPSCCMSIRPRVLPNAVQANLWMNQIEQLKSSITFAIQQCQSCSFWWLQSHRDREMMTSIPSCSQCSS